MDRTEMTKEELRNLIANVNAGDMASTECVGIALASYFEGHMDLPEVDEIGEDGWSVWAIAQMNHTLDAIVEAIYPLLKDN
jgi:hypothetical protein